MSILGTVTVPLRDRAYDVVVGTGLVADAATHLADMFARPRTAVVTDDRIAELHLPALQGALVDAGIEVTVVKVPSGEGSKSFPHIEALLDQLLDARIERADTICALGGGVICDLTGFAASIFRRGVGVVDIPTPLLAQVDAAIGGKTGVTLPEGKNLVGAFWQPTLVLCDTAALETLPAREMRCGLGEMAKYPFLSHFGHICPIFAPNFFPRKSGFFTFLHY